MEDRPARTKDAPKTMVFRETTPPDDGAPWKIDRRGPEHRHSPKGPARALHPFLLFCFCLCQPAGHSAAATAASEPPASRPNCHVTTGYQNGVPQTMVFTETTPPDDGAPWKIDRRGPEHRHSPKGPARALHPFLLFCFFVSTSPPAPIPPIAVQPATDPASSYSLALLPGTTQKQQSRGKWLACCSRRRSCSRAAGCAAG